MFVITSSALGQGTFECTATLKIENFLLDPYPGPDFIQYGNFSGCRGTGDFAGMKMKGYGSNQPNPGIFIYWFWGEMW